MDSAAAASASDRMLVVMFDVTGMSDLQVKSLEASMSQYAHERYISTEVYDGGPVSLRVCKFGGNTFRADDGWRPVETVERMINVLEGVA